MAHAPSDVPLSLSASRLSSQTVTIGRDEGRGSASDNDDTECSSTCDDKFSRSSSSSCGGSASELTTVTLTTEVLDVSCAPASANTPNDAAGCCVIGRDIQHKNPHRLSTGDSNVPAVSILSGNATSSQRTQPNEVMSAMLASTVPALSNVADTAPLGAPTMAALPDHSSNAGVGAVVLPSSLALPPQKHPNLLYHYLRIIFQHCKVNIDYSHHCIVLDNAMPRQCITLLLSDQY